eukprot:Tbor_TRINITY_DN5545_c4_g6::TRINITY_DN5545_c4_g6_i2::g.13501::m.13501
MIRCHLEMGKSLYRIVTSVSTSNARGLSVRSARYNSSICRTPELSITDMSVKKEMRLATDIMSSGHDQSRRMTKVGNATHYTALGRINDVSHIIANTNRFNNNTLKSLPAICSQVSTFTHVNATNAMLMDTIARGQLILCQSRGIKVNGKSTGSESDSTKEGDETTDKNKTDKSDENDTKNKNNEDEGTKSGGGIRGFITGLRNDVRDFPDIYNVQNGLHFIIFTCFCLCSTGTSVEEEWWMKNWGIDADFCPWAWPLHSVLVNNFLSMSLAMLLMHSLVTGVIPTLGARSLLLYMGIIATVSGAIMWGGNYAMGWTHEKQFGPWDISAGLFVMHALRQGIMPWTILNSFNGWMKYAIWVGVLTICYYDWQPVITGTGIGFALCKLHPKFRGVAVAGGV